MPTIATITAVAHYYEIIEKNWVVRNESYEIYIFVFHKGGPGADTIFADDRLYSSEKNFSYGEEVHGLSGDMARFC